MAKSMIKMEESAASNNIGTNKTTVTNHVAVINHMKNDSAAEESDEHLLVVKGMIGG